jgi:hypothetical protein
LFKEDLPGCDDNNIIRTEHYRKAALNAKLVVALTGRYLNSSKGLCEEIQESKIIERVSSLKISLRI